MFLILKILNVFHPKNMALMPKTLKSFMNYLRLPAKLAAAPAKIATRILLEIRL